MLYLVLTLLIILGVTATHFSQRSHVLSRGRDRLYACDVTIGLGRPRIYYIFRLD